VDVLTFFDNNDAIDTIERTKSTTDDNNNLIEDIDSSPTDSEKTELEIINLAVTKDENGDDVIDLDILESINNNSNINEQQRPQRKIITDNEKEVDKPRVVVEKKEIESES